MDTLPPNTPRELSTLLDSARNNFARGISLGQAASTSVMAYGVQVGPFDGGSAGYWASRHSAAFPARGQ